MSTPEGIVRIRALFECELAGNPTAYHPIDIQRVRDEDWQIGRFLVDKIDESKAFEALCRALRWKNQFGIHERTDQYFPLEFWTLSGSEMAGHDRAGRPIVWRVGRHYRRFSEIVPLTQQFVAHVMERADRTAPGEPGCVSIHDSTGSSIFNIDRDIQRFLTELFDYYPGLFTAMYLVNLPWLLNSIIRLFIGWLDPRMAKSVHLITSAELPALVDPEWIPVALGGQRERQILPENLISLEKRAQDLGLSDKFVDYYYRTYKLNRSN